MALSPQADLATEPRWSRINGTFGEDAALAQKLVRAYVEGFQHGENGADSTGVLTIVKHWVGYGAEKNGFDSHNRYGRFAEFEPGKLEYHVRPFLGAFQAHVAGVMPTYSTSRGRDVEWAAARAGRRGLQQAAAHRPAAQSIWLRWRGPHRLGDHERLRREVPQRRADGRASLVRDGRRCRGASSLSRRRIAS